MIGGDIMNETKSKRKLNVIVKIFITIFVVFVGFNLINIYLICFYFGKTYFIFTEERVSEVEELFYIDIPDKSKLSSYTIRWGMQAADTYELKLKNISDYNEFIENINLELSYKAEGYEETKEVVHEKDLPIAFYQYKSEYQYYVFVYEAKNDKYNITIKTFH